MSTKCFAKFNHATFLPFFYQIYHTYFMPLLKLFLTLSQLNDLAVNICIFLKRVIAPVSRSTCTCHKSIKSIYDFVPQFHLGSLT